MRIWTITKRTLLVLFFVFLSIGILIGVAFKKSEMTSAKNKLLPIYAVDTKQNKIAITFDVAWSNDDIDKILEILKSHNATATFFIVGTWADKFPNDVKKIHNAGHLIANHSDTHKEFSKCNKSELRQEIINCNNKLSKIIGNNITYLRAPSGDYTNDSINISKSLGMYMVQWDIDSLDYRKLSVQEIVNRVVPSATKGSIVLFHTGVENTAKALDMCLTELKKQGYEFVSVDDLIYKDNFTIDHTGRQKITKGTQKF